MPHLGSMVVFVSKHIGGTMGQKICPICTLWLSAWAQACGRTTTINGVEYHTDCLKDKTIKEVVGK